MTGGTAWILRWRPTPTVKGPSYVPEEEQGTSVQSLQRARLFGTSKEAAIYAAEELGHPECWSIERVQVTVSEVNPL